MSRTSGFYEIELVFHLADICLLIFYEYRKNMYIDLKESFIKNIRNIMCIAYFTLVLGLNTLKRQVDGWTKEYNYRNNHLTAKKILQNMKILITDLLQKASNLSKKG